MRERRAILGQKKMRVSRLMGKGCLGVCKEIERGESSQTDAFQAQRNRAYKLAHNRQLHSQKEWWPAKLVADQSIRFLVRGWLDDAADMCQKMPVISEDIWHSQHATRQEPKPTSCHLRQVRNDHFKSFSRFELESNTHISGAIF